ncbi:putative quinol monooxygenase [Halorhabdus salina]|uniref:putative quinol monooxygenase n=1 Tax=Halorhabdus salina TaxID=2750670 RepID=UPI0015EEEB67|nr:putative quinol monooxygenase [Halorhabdus salina]
MIVIHAEFPIEPAHHEAATEAAETLVEATTEEPGAIEYSAAIDLQDEHVLRFVERYEDEAAFEAHASSDHFSAFEERLPDLLAGEPTVRRFDVESAAELEL